MYINRNKSRLFYKFLFSYLAILLIPLIIIGIMVYSYFMGIFQKEVINNSLSTLEQTKVVIDAQYIQLRKISDQIYLNQNLLPFNFNENPMQGIIAKNELSTYAYTNNFFSEIILYYNGSDYLFTSKSSYPINRFMDFYRFENWNKESFIKDISTFIEPVVRPIEKVYEFNGYNEIEKHHVAFIFPHTFNNLNPDRTSIILVPQESFQKLLQNTLKDYNINTIILDPQNNVIFSLQDQPYLHSDDLIKLLSNDDGTGSKKITIQNKQYLYSYIKSSETQWKYVTLTPVKNVFEKVNNIKLIFIYGFGIVILLGLTIIYFMMNLNYSPIQKLKLYTEMFWKEGKSSSNELETFKSTLDFLNNQNTELHGQLENSSHAVKEYLLFRLLQGRISSLDDLNKKGEKIGFKMTKMNFRVVIFYSNIFKSSSNNENCNFSKMIEDSLPPEIEGYVRDQNEHNQLTLITSYDVINTTLLGNTLLDIQKNLQTELRTAITLGVGNEYSDITLIPKSYMEALTAIDYRLLKGINKIIYFNEITYSQSTLDTSLSRAPEKLKLLIKQGNTDQIENFLTNIVNYMNENNTSIFTAKMVCFDIINTIVRTMDEINNEYFVPKKEYPDVLLVSTFETVDELTEIVKRISQDICNYLKEINEKESVTLIDRMVLYLRDNYTDCDFSIQQMADYFKMSLPHLSQYFKDQAGITVIDYETNLKIEKAKQLLANSNIALKDIAVEVGYYNTTSFIRRFKQLVGVTPGEYRRQIPQSPI